MSRPELRIASPLGTLEATFVPGAGMVCPSLRHRGREVLEQRRGLEAYATTGKTMGIPLLYPWANRLERSRYLVADRAVELPADPAIIPRDPNGLPNHGVIPGLMRWEAQATGGRCTALLPWAGDVLLGAFPYRHEVALEATVSEHALTVTTTVRATGADPVPVSFGFHPYLRLPDDRDRCAIELPPGERLTLDDRGIPTGTRTELAVGRRALKDGDWDDGLALREPESRFSVDAPAGTRAVELLDGYRYGQIFSPSGAAFICFEPMTAPANAMVSGDGLRVLHPGEEHRATFRVLVGPD